MPEKLTLTIGERLLIERRRNDENQREAAARHGCTQSAYQALELDKPGHSIAYKPAIGRLKAHEDCFLRRRRAGRTRAWLADQLGLSRHWITQMERGTQDCTRLVKFWEG